MKKPRGKASLFNVATVFASFFGAALIAGAYAYFHYKFNEYKFIDFNKWALYSKTDVFQPTDEHYIVIMYSSKSETIEPSKLTSKHPILAIDFYQQTFDSTDKITFLRTGTNTLLSIIQRFNIYEVPTIFIIKKYKDTLYKQDSMIHKFKNLQEIETQIKDL
jgi:hypothetical protein